jgi:hypothetical protein
VRGAIKYAGAGVRSQDAGVCFSGHFCVVRRGGCRSANWVKIAGGNVARLHKNWYLCGGETGEYALPRAAGTGGVAPAPLLLSPFPREKQKVAKGKRRPARSRA